MKRKLSGMLVMVLVCGMTIFGCGARSLDGTWETNAEGSMITPVIEFSGNNFTVFYKDKDRGPRPGLNGTYSIYDDKIEFEFPPPAGKNVYPFSRTGKEIKISGNLYTRRK